MDSVKLQNSRKLRNVTISWLYINLAHCHNEILQFYSSKIQRVYGCFWKALVTSREENGSYVEELVRNEKCPNKMAKRGTQKCTYLQPADKIFLPRLLLYPHIGFGYVRDTSKTREAKCK